MTDTAQSAMTADPNVQLANAADAFKAFTSEAPIIPRDDKGRFASEAIEEELEEAEGELDAATDDVEEQEDAEAAEEAQPEPVDLPASWSKEDAELWESLPADAQGKIAEREAERDRAVNQKFQEAANVKKATEAQLTEANANRDNYVQAVDLLLATFQLQEPDPRAYGAGTGNYNREGYDLAVVNWKQNAQSIRQFEQQREAITAQQAQEQRQAFEQWKSLHEAEYSPKFIADVPEMSSPDKVEPFLRDLVSYALSSGIPEETFAPESQHEITSAQLHILWKAKQYDAIKAAKGKVQETPAPKPSQPAVKPGVATSRSATKQAAMRKATERLASEGSIEAGAAVWKNFLT